MSYSIKLSVFFLNFLLVLLFSFLLKAERREELLRNGNDYPDYSDHNFTYLVTGGYRPSNHILTKYIVSLRLGHFFYFFGDNHFCGGSIISPKVILTAAHCIKGTNAYHRSQLKVIVGSIRRLEQSPSTVEHSVAKIHKHPGFRKKTFVSDIALLILNEPIIENDITAQSIPLPQSSPRVGDKCTTVGWGRVYNHGPMPDEAVYADVYIKSFKFCKKRQTIMKSGMMCANDPSDPEKDSCTGDSGGPLICNGQVVGVVSIGFGCGTPGFPGIYSDVWYYRTWIRDNEAHKIKGSLNPVFLVFGSLLLSSL